jgi:hypothetical protein
MDDGSDVTSEKEQAVLDALRERPTYVYAARKARIHRRTLYRWRMANPDFDARVQAAKNEGFDALEDAMVDRGMKDDTTAAIFMLKAWRPERYRETHNLNVSGNVSATVTVLFEQREDGPQ